MQDYHYLTNEQLAELGQDLTKSLEEREHVNELSMKEATEEHEKITDASDQGTQYESQSNSLALGNHSSARCKELREALERFKKEPEDFGYCIAPNCGTEEQEIGFKRLKANPTAKYCIECQSIEEIRKKI